MTATHDEHPVFADLFQPVDEHILADLLAAEEMWPADPAEEVRGD